MTGRSINSALVRGQQRIGLCPKMKNHPLCGWIFIKDKTCLLIKAYSLCVPDAAGAAGDCFLPVMMRRRGETAIIAPAPIRVITNSGSI